MESLAEGSAGETSGETNPGWPGSDSQGRKHRFKGERSWLAWHQEGLGLLLAETGTQALAQLGPRARTTGSRGRCLLGKPGWMVLCEGTRGRGRWLGSVLGLGGQGDVLCVRYTGRWGGGAAAWVGKPGLSVWARDTAAEKYGLVEWGRNHDMDFARSVLPEPNDCGYKLRHGVSKPLPKVKTNRFKNTFVNWCLFSNHPCTASISYFLLFFLTLVTFFKCFSNCHATWHATWQSVLLFLI